jgi:hypothetical protein
VNDSGLAIALKDYHLSPWNCRQGASACDVWPCGIIRGQPLTTDVLAGQSREEEKVGTARPFLLSAGIGRKERFSSLRVTGSTATRNCAMKGIILWLMGVPLIVIILLYMFVF